MKVAVISAIALTEDIQYRGGFNARYSSVVRALSASFETSLVILGTEIDDRPKDASLKVYFIPTESRIASARKRRRILGTLAPTYFRPSWARAVLTVLEEIQPSAVFVTFPNHVEIAASIASLYPTVVFVEENTRQVHTGLTGLRKIWAFLFSQGSPIGPRGLASSKAVLVISERERSWAAHFRKPVYVVPHALNLQYWQAPPGRVSVNYGRSTFFCIGSFEVMSWAMGLLEIVEELDRGYPGHGITIVCASSRGYHSCIANMGSTLKLEGSIADPRPYYQSAVATLVPSFLVAGSKTTLLQGWATGCSVVTTEAASAAVGGCHGVDLMEGSSPREVAELMVRLANDSGLRARLIEGGLRRIKEEHTDEVLGRALADVLKNVLET